jgi:hypothetical protein
MKFWKIFWTLNLVVAGAGFAFITAVVTVKGVNDLRLLEVCAGKPGKVIDTGEGPLGGAEINDRLR